MPAIKKPKKLKFPKKPKATASIEVMKKYLAKRAEIEKTNRQREAAYVKAKKERETLQKKISGL